MKQHYTGILRPNRDYLESKYAQHLPKIEEDQSFMYYTM